MPQPKVELGGCQESEVLHLAPANGFPPGTYLPLLRLLGGFRRLSLPPRALWGLGPPPRDRRGWRQAAEDLLAGLARYELRDIIAVGHSFGGVASMLALLEEPERFKALIMLDPVLLAPTMLAQQKAAWDAGVIDQHPLVQSALRRRRVFNSRDDAFARFRAKAVFADWSDESLRLYIEHGLREGRGGYELRWDTAWEAYYFSNAHEQVWEDLPKLRNLAPVLIVRAGDSHTFPRDCVEWARSLLPTADIIELEGQGHLFPLAAPKLTASVISDWLASI